jgi:hypothetical protein
VAAVTTRQLLYELQQACNCSPLVSHVEERVVDADILSVRVYLMVTHTFINVFYNVTTDKTAFALVEGDRRLYGVDNAKMGWHRHPFDNPGQHIPCAPVRFEEFLADVEAYFLGGHHPTRHPS